MSANKRKDEATPYDVVPCDELARLRAIEARAIKIIGVGSPEQVETARFILGKSE